MKPKEGKRYNHRRMQAITPGLESRNVRNIDALATFDSIFSGTLAEIQKDVAAGLTSEQIVKKYAALAAARTASIALTSENEATALAASKDILDRSQGKAVERKIVKHAMNEAEEREIDALLESKLKEVNPGLVEDGDNGDEDAD